jgi:hypothetical protein
MLYLSPEAGARLGDIVKHTGESEKAIIEKLLLAPPPPAVPFGDSGHQRAEEADRA